MGISLEVPSTQERRTPPLTDEERIARYVYLLNTLPASVIESAHAKAFEDVPPERRREMFEQLARSCPRPSGHAASDDPTVLARLVRRAEERRAERAASGGRMPRPRSRPPPASRTTRATRSTRAR